jgi:hypothetical protein
VDKLELVRQILDPLHGLKGVSLIKSFSNAFSNAGNFAHSRTDVGEIKRPIHYACDHEQSPAN